MSFEKVNRIWQLLGGALFAPAFLTWLVASRLAGDEWNPYQWLLWLHLPLLMIHEFEEYILPGGFKVFANTQTFFALKKPKEDTPLSEPYVFFVNIFVCWAWIVAGAVLAPSYPWVGYGPIAMQIGLNIVQHSCIFQFPHKGYNPGLVTNVVLFVPYCTYATYYIVRHKLFSPLDWGLSIGSAVAVTVLFASITFTRNTLAMRKGQAKDAR